MLNKLAWLQTIKTFIPAFVACGIYWALEIWRFTVWFIVFRAIEPEIAILPLLYLVGVIIASLVWFVLTLVFYRFLLKLLWSTPPTWLTWHSRWANLKGWLIMVVATFPSATIAFWNLRVFDIPVRKSLIEFFQEHPLHQNFVLFACLWVICAAYLFQVTQGKQK